MPKRVLDFDALWASDKIASCAAWAQAEYAWLYGLADASGSFELTNLRVIWGRVAAVRKDLTLERLEEIFQEFIARGLLFTWEAGGKRYGHWTGSDVPGRLPPPSWRSRLERLAPPVPRQKLAEYMAQFGAGQAAWAEGGKSRRERQSQEIPAGEQTTEGTWNGGDSGKPASQAGAAPLKHGLEQAQGQEWVKDGEGNWNGNRETPNAPVCAFAAGASKATAQAAPETWPAACAGQGGAAEGGPSQGQSGDLAAPVAAKTKDDLFAEELFAIYERERGTLPAAAELTGERRRQCALRRRSGLRPEKFAEAVRRAAATPFLAGQGARGWRANFDWLIANDTNVRKVTEGAYESGAPGPQDENALRWRGAGWPAMTARERAVYSELHVGTGPVASDYGVRVRPEALERARAREELRRRAEQAARSG